MSDASQYHHNPSGNPMTNTSKAAYIPLTEANLEEAIQGLKLTAPRILPRELVELIEHVEYVEHTTLGGKLIRWCILSMKGGGHAVVGDPNITFSPENDRPEFGRKLAYDKAFDAMWPLVAFNRFMETKAAVDLMERTKAGLKTGQWDKPENNPLHASPIHATDLNPLSTAAPEVKVTYSNSEDQRDQIQLGADEGRRHHKQWKRRTLKNERRTSDGSESH